jgi:hypothetical protein
LSPSHNLTGFLESPTDYGESRIIQFRLNPSARQREIKIEDLPSPESTLPPQHSLKRRRSFDEHDEDLPLSPQPEANVSLQIQDMEQIDKFFKLTLDELLQVDLKLILKTFIKIIEPHKQKNWPYRSLRKQVIKPPWWPDKRKDNGDLALPYNEPDHLKREHCQALAFHLLKWLMSDPAAFDYDGRFKDRPVAFVQEQFRKANLQQPDVDGDCQKAKKRREYLDRLFTIAVTYEQFRRDEIGKPIIQRDSLHKLMPDH